MIDLSNLRAQLEHAVIDLEAGGLPDLVAICAATQARAIARLATATTPAPATGWLTAEQVAEALNVRPSAIHEWNRAGRIPCEHFGRFVRFDLEAVRRALNSKITELGAAPDAKRRKGQRGALTSRLPHGGIPPANQAPERTQ